MNALGEVFSWLPQIINWILGWIPHMGRIQSFEAAVKVSGPVVTEIKNSARLWKYGPRGLFFYIPHFTDVFKDNVVRKVQELPEQLLTTQDGKKVRVGGILVYHIANIVTWLTDNEDPEHGVQVEAARVLREWVVTMSFEAIQNFRPTKRGEDDLTRSAQTQMGSDFGVRIRQLSMASFAETDSRDIHHSGHLGQRGDAPTTIVHLT